MRKIPVSNFKAKLGSMNAHLFHNPSIGLEPTLFYEIRIPLEPFASGLEWEEQPVNTEFQLDFLVFPVKDWRELNRKSYDDISEENADASVYLGTAHNPVQIKHIYFEHLEQNKFRIECILLCNFAFERVANKETVKLSAEADFEGLKIRRSIIENKSTNNNDIANAISHLVTLGAYESEPQIDEHYITLLPKTVMK
ncbi:MAG: hypothetical protein ABIU06_05325 [Anaerolineales bacterium]